MDGGVADELLLRLLPGGEEDQELRVEELEHLLGDVLQTLSRLDTKRGRLEGQIAAASRGRRRRASNHAPPHGGRAPEPAVAYTRKGAGAVRRRLIVAAGDVERERERLEAMWGQLEAALVDARERLALAQQLRLGAA